MLLNEDASWTEIIDYEQVLPFTGFSMVVLSKSLIYFELLKE